MKNIRRKSRRHSNRKIGLIAMIIAIVVVAHIIMVFEVAADKEDPMEKYISVTMIEHQVEAGENLWSIAESVVDDYNVTNDTVGNIVERIRLHNEIKEGDLLPIGTTVVVPFYI